MQDFCILVFDDVEQSIGDLTYDVPLIQPSLAGLGARTSSPTVENRGLFSIVPLGTPKRVRLKLSFFQMVAPCVAEHFDKGSRAIIIMLCFSFFPLRLRRPLKWTPAVA